MAHVSIVTEACITVQDATTHTMTLRYCSWIYIWTLTLKGNQSSHAENEG